MRFAVISMVMLIVVSLVPGAIEAAESTGQPPVTYEEGILPATSNFSEAAYPPSAQRQGHIGRVSLGYSVDKRGIARSVTVLSSDHGDLAAAAKDCLKRYRFNVSHAWESSGGSSRRYRIGFIFKLKGYPDPPSFEDKQETVVLTASTLGFP